MTDKELIIENIPAEKFEFAGNRDLSHDAKFDTKPVGYFRDAFRRFRKNKGSVVAGIIILVLLIYALLVPLASTPVAKNVCDSYYAKLGPRLTWAYGLVNGSTKKEYNENLLLNFYSMGVGAEYRYDAATGTEKVPTFDEGVASYYNPVVRTRNQYTVQQGANKVSMYTANVDAYLGVGFIYKQLSASQYQELVKYQEESGIQILYPMIDTDSDYYFGKGTTNEYPNYWYKASTDRKSRGAPLDENDKVQSLSKNGTVNFIDIYLRDEEGKPVYYVRNGGGTAETAGYKVRVLYYNYYRYLNGCEPNYVLGCDSQGYDMAYRLATGMRLSFILSILVSAINFIIGAIYGAIEGYYGGAADLIMERVSDILASVPFIVVATLFQLHLAKKVGAFPSLLFAFVMTGWIGTAARVRSQFYRFKNSEYVLAARTLGARDRRIMWKHIFPNSLGTLVTSSVLVIPGVIFSESMLSYLGIAQLGTATSTSLGTLLSEASTLWNVGYVNLLIIPAVVISLLMICFNLFGNGLRDAFNPTLRGADE